jgi:hypothetical protein
MLCNVAIFLANAAISELALNVRIPQLRSAVLFPLPCKVNIEIGIDDDAPVYLKYILRVN